MKRLLLLLALTLSTALHATEPPLLQRVYPEQVGLDSHAFVRADSLVHAAIDEGIIPGGVLAVLRHNKIAYLKAYGNKRLTPTIEPMTEEVIFDLASLTKPLATGIATMKLLERGQILLQDPVSRYLPEWREDEGITIRHLLTHTSGLPAYASVTQVKAIEEGVTLQEKLAHHLATMERHSAPGEKMVYSCLNYITLQYIIEAVTGENLSDYLQSEVYRPMGLRHTGFQPAPHLLPLVAPTEVQPDGRALHGVVHDPLARELNLGISGNAGLFSNAEEVAALAAMLLNKGAFRGRQILSPATVRAFTSIPMGYEKFGRTLSWSGPTAWNHGNLSSSSVYGHTGYTGTSLSIDPERDMAIIFLSNRVHPKDSVATSRLNAQLHNVITSAIREEDYFAHFPSYYYDRWHAQEEQTPIAPSDIVMLGNSITEGGKNWNDLLPHITRRVVNRGISGDTTRGILHRLDEIERQKPHKLFLLIGINDLSHSLSPAEIVAGITYILERIHLASPETQLYLQTVLPINETSYQRFKALDGKAWQVPRINTLIKELATQLPHVTLIDLYPHFLDSEGKWLHSGYTYDGLHLNSEGYQLWAEIITPYMVE